jgi:hypothetical protein
MTVSIKSRADAALEQSLKEYFEIERDERFRSDPVVPFRIANALLLRGYKEIAFDKFEEAYDKLAGSSLEPMHDMRTRIPRTFAVMLWEQAEGIRRDAKKLNNPDLLLDYRLELYLRALDVTMGVLGSDTKSQSTDASGTSDRLKAVNNIVEFILSYLRAGGVWSEIEKRGISKEKLKGYVDEIGGKSIAKIELATLADTVRFAANFFEDDDLVERAARRVLQLASKPNLSAGISEEAYAEMKLDAEADLTRLGRQGV